MSSNFDKSSHKNLELLRYHLIEKIDSIIFTLNKPVDDSSLSSNIFVSMVDVLIVILFNDYLLKDKGILSKLIFLSVLIISYEPLRLFYKHIIYKIKGFFVRKDKIMNLSEKNTIVKRFDNIAFDNLLFCHDYIEKYESEINTHIKDFYFHEIIYYLNNAHDIFSPILTHSSIYIQDSSQQKNKIEKYRVNNFINISKDISYFVSQNCYKYNVDKALENKIKNLMEAINSYNEIK